MIPSIKDFPSTGRRALGEPMRLDSPAERITAAIMGDRSGEDVFHGSGFQVGDDFGDSGNLLDLVDDPLLQGGLG